MTTQYLHSVFNSFPVAMLITLIVMELIYLWKQSEQLKSGLEIVMFCTVIGTLLSFITGYQAQHHASQSFEVPDEVIAAHLNLGRLLLFSVIATATLGYFRFRALHGRAVWRGFYFLSLLVSCILLYLTGSKGGELVYSYGAGVLLGS